MIVTQKIPEYPRLLSEVHSGSVWVVDVGVVGRYTQMFVTTAFLEPSMSVPVFLNCCFFI